MMRCLTMQPISCSKISFSRLVVALARMQQAVIHVGMVRHSQVLARVTRGTSKKMAAGVNPGHGARRCRLLCAISVQDAVLLARAVKEHERRNGAALGFAAEEPGDCLAFKYYRDVRISCILLHNLPH